MWLRVCPPMLLPVKLPPAKICIRPAPRGPATAPFALGFHCLGRAVREIHAGDAVARHRRSPIRRNRGEKAAHHNLLSA